MMVKKALAMILAAALLAPLFMGCASKDLYLMNYEKVYEGVTTKDDVEKFYGKPKNIFTHPGGSESWSYDYDFSTEYQQKFYNFKFLFDKNGVVINKSQFISKWP